MKVHEDKAETPLTFQTGSGKLVAAKKSSFEKAFAILGDLDDETFSGDSSLFSFDKSDRYLCTSVMIPDVNIPSKLQK